MTEKEKRKQILKQVKAKEKQAFIQSLPMEKQIFIDLFNFLNENLIDCDNEMTMTSIFLEGRGIDNEEEVIAWLNDKGGYCDCEVLNNVEGQFE